MAAPLGFKTFNSGDVLTAADTNGYLMQGVWTFANAAARTAAVTSPQEGNVSFLKDTNSLEIYDGAAWVAYGSGDITGVTAGTGISGGGTAGDVTITNSMATAIDAKGDLIAGTGADAFSRLAIGSNNQVLTADSTQATGMKWATPAAGAWTLLHTITPTNTATTVSQSGISTAYRNLRIVGLGCRHNGTGTTNQTGNLRFNSNTGTVYLYAGSPNTSAVNAFYLYGAQPESVFVLDIFEYSQTSYLKPFQITAAAGSATGGTILSQFAMGYFNSTAAITEFSITLNASQTFQGTGVFYVFGGN